MMKMIMLVMIGASLVACKMPEQAPKEPVDAVCLAKVEAILACKSEEASQLDEASAKLTMKSVEANRKQANISTERCNGTLAKYASDPCNR